MAFAIILHNFQEKPFFILKVFNFQSYKGKGYENVEHYNKCEFQFLGIENIHVMRKSLERLEMDGWLASDWLKHIYAVLDVSNKVKQAVQEGRTVIVHCSDGWDRTSQVCSGYFY